MAASGLGDINPYMGKGELLTGDQSMEWIIKTRKSRLIKRVSVPPGEDGTVLHADSRTNTGLRWAVPDEPLATSLGNSVNLIVEFLKPLVEERVRKETERLESIPLPLKIHIRPIFGDSVYSVPFNTTDTVQNLIDYLNKTFLVSLIHGDFTLSHHGQILEPGRTLGSYSIQNDEILDITSVPVQSAGKFKTRKNHKNRISKNKRRKRTLHK
jgi:hypothetical protein